MDKIQEMKRVLDAEFTIKDLGQRTYTLDSLEYAGMLGCQLVSFPMEKNVKLDKYEGEVMIDVNHYRHLVGRLLYLQSTSPYITYVANVLSQLMSDPCTRQLQAANQVLRYLKATPVQGILLTTNGGSNLITYCDSDWFGFPMTRMSRTGYLHILGGSPISWKSKKQSVGSRSSAEAEYIAITSNVCEVVWMRWLLKELCMPCHGRAQVFRDNQAARQISNNLVFHEQTKTCRNGLLFCSRTC